MVVVLDGVLRKYTWTDGTCKNNKQKSGEMLRDAMSGNGGGDNDFSKNIVDSEGITICAQENLTFVIRICLDDGPQIFIFSENSPLV